VSEGGLLNFFFFVSGGDIGWKERWGNKLEGWHTSLHVAYHTVCTVLKYLQYLPRLIGSLRLSYVARDYPLRCQAIPDGWWGRAGL